jgi:hypothetical protein
MRPMELLGDVGHVESPFGPFGYNVSVDEDRCTWVMCNLISVHLEIMLVSVQGWCTVCAKCTIDLEIVLDAHDGTPR